MSMYKMFSKTGCLNLNWLEQDSDLDPVRDNSRFKEIITRFKGIPEAHASGG